MIKMIVFNFGSKSLRTYGKYLFPYFNSTDLYSMIHGNPDPNPDPVSDPVSDPDSSYLDKVHAKDKTTLSLLDPDNRNGNGNTVLVSEYGAHTLFQTQTQTQTQTQNQNQNQTQTQNGNTQQIQRWFVTEVLPAIRSKGYEQDSSDKDRQITRLIAGKRRHYYYKFMKGPSFYIISDNHCTCHGNKKYKVGIEGVNINRRLQQHRTTLPALKVDYLMYCKDNDLIEKILLTKYRKNRSPFLNHEWIFDVDVKELINEVEFQADHLNLEYKVEDQLSQYNDQISNLAKHKKQKIQHG